MKRNIIILCFTCVSSFSTFLDAQLKQGEFTFERNGNEGTGSMIQTNDGGYIIAGGTDLWGYIIKLDFNATIQWSKKIGGTKDNAFSSIVQCKDGDYVVSGYTGSYGAGGDDVYVIKLDKTGNIVWTKTIGGVNYDYGYSVIQSKDGGFVIGGSTGVGSYDVYVIKLDSNGSLQWTKTIGGTGDDQGYSIIQSKDGDFVIAGRTNSYGAGNYDVYVIKLNSTGNIVWTKTIGGTGDDEGNSIIQCKDGGYVITGYTASYGAGSNDMYVIKLDSSGNLSWTKTIGGTNDDRGNCIIQNKDGGYTIVGNTNSYGMGIGSNVYLVCLDSLSNLLWTKAIGGIYDDVGNSIVQCKDGGYVIAGGTNSFGAGGHYLYFLKTDSLGNTCFDTGSGGLVSSGGIVGSGGAVGSLGTISSGGLDSSVVTIPSTLCSVLSIQDILNENYKFRLYPNPSSNILNVDLGTQPNLYSDKTDVQITDITGRVLLLFNNQNPTINISLNISSLSSGMYFIRLNSNSRTEVMKFIKE